MHVVSDKLSTVTGSSGMSFEADQTIITTQPALFDALYIVGSTSEQQSKRPA